MTLVMSLSILYVLAFVFLIATCYIKKLFKYHTLAKFINSIGFIAVATGACLFSGQWSLYFAMLPGLILCLVGDVMLALDNSRALSKYFLPGLTSFLIGHILFVWAFSMRVPFSLYDLILPVIAVILTFFIVRMKGIDVGKLRVAVIIYSFFVALLFSKGISLVLVNGMTPVNSLLCRGAFLFLLSDAIVLFLLFYEKKHFIVRFCNLATYYGGMFLIALSLAFI